MKKKIILLSSLLMLFLIYFVGSGFRTMDNVYLVDYTVSPKQDEITISVSVMSSIGYTRAVKNVSDDPEKLELKFYAAFGGMNGSIGKQHRFVIDLPKECNEIYLYTFGSNRLTLVKNESTGEWERVDR